MDYLSASTEAIVAAAAALTALGYLARLARRTLKRVEEISGLADRVRDLQGTVDDLDTLVTRELTHNHGSSIKDDVHGLAIAVGQQSREIDDLREAFFDQLDRRRKWRL